MTLPSSGQLGFDQIDTELGNTSHADVGLGDPDLRLLSGVSAGAIRASDFYGKSSGVAPTYYGILASPLATNAELQTLTSAVVVLPYYVTLTAGQNQYMYYVSPQSAGPVQFYDRQSTFVGGWDGAMSPGPNMNQYIGPAKTTINDVPYYVYRTDFPNLGKCFWEAQVDLDPPYEL